MAAYTPLAAVQTAIFQLLAADPTLVGLVTGGVQTDIPTDPAYPLLWVEVLEQRQLGGFGTKAGVGALLEVEIRLHVFSLFHGMAECQAIMAQAIKVVSATGALAVVGYNVCGPEPFHDQTLPLPNQILNGTKVDEMVSLHRLYVEELP